MISVKKIIITGATGFIGTNLINLLIKKYTSLQIIAIDNLKNSNLVDFKKILKENKFEIKKNIFLKKNLKIFFIKKDFALTTKLININFKEVDCLVHLASQTGVIQSMKSPEKDASENILKTIKFIQFLKDKGLKKIIYASSMGVLGDNLYSSNESKHDPLNFYAASKASVENYLNVYSKTLGIKSYILRFSNIYGKYSKLKTSVIASFIKSILKKGKIKVNGSGKQYRDFLFVEDLAEIINTLIFTKNNNNYYRKPIHVATGKSISINQLVSIFKKKLQLKFKIIKKNKNKGDIQKSFVKIDEVKKIKKNFTDIQKGLKITYNWFNNSI